MVQCVAVWCSVVQYGAACCSVLQCVAVWFSVLQCVAVSWVLNGLSKITAELNLERLCCVDWESEVRMCLCVKHAPKSETQLMCDLTHSHVF